MITVGVAGKGGTGKTTVCALTIVALKRAGKRPLLAVDADPSSMLCEVLGVPAPPSLVSLVDEVGRSFDKLPQGMDKSRYLEYRIREAVSENRDFPVPLMARTEGPGCYCYANHLLRDHLDRLEKNYQFVVIDNEAGLEHLSRRTTRQLDLLLLTTITSRTSLLSVERILEMVNDRNLDIRVGKVCLVVNEMAGNSLPSLAEKFSLPSFRLPVDREILTRSEKGQGLMDLPDDSPALVSIKDNLLPILNSLVN